MALQPIQTNDFEREKHSQVLPFFIIRESSLIFEGVLFIGDKKQALLLRWQVLVILYLLHYPHLERGYLGRDKNSRSEARY